MYVWLLRCYRAVSWIIEASVSLYQTVRSCVDDVWLCHPLRSFSQMAIILSHRCPLHVCEVVRTCVFCKHEHRKGPLLDQHIYVFYLMYANASLHMCVCVCVHKWAHVWIGNWLITCITLKHAHHVILRPYVVNNAVMDGIISMPHLHSTALNLQPMENQPSIDVEAGMKETH